MHTMVTLMLLLYPQRIVDFHSKTLLEMYELA